MKRRNSQKRIKTAIFSAIAVASLGLLAGCELLVDFDRTLIDGGALGAVDATFDSSETFDASNDASDSTTTPDASDASDATTTTDAGDSGLPQDAGEDADADAG
ncbi:MAG: hypothetical protein ABI461_09875 [Polyangiaceae bacterium]